VTLHSANGSTVRLLNEQGTAYEIDWNWFDEGTCFDSRAYYDPGEPGFIIAECECHGTKKVAVEAKP
jgi:hypothetical protein